MTSNFIPDLTHNGEKDFRIQYWTNWQQNYGNCFPECSYDSGLDQYVFTDADTYVFGWKLAVFCADIQHVHVGWLKVSRYTRSFTCLFSICPVCVLEWGTYHTSIYPPHQLLSRKDGTSTVGPHTEVTTYAQTKNQLHFICFLYDRKCKLKNKIIMLSIMFTNMKNKYVKY